MREGGLVNGDSQESTHELEIGVDKDDQVEMEEEESLPTLANIGKRKRKRDIYEVDAVHSEYSGDGGEFEEPAREITKRAPGSKKSKPSILWPKKDQRASTKRVTRATAQAATKNLKSDGTNRRTTHAVVEIAVKAPKNAKRLRGPPPEAKRDELGDVNGQPLDEGRKIEAEVEDADEGPEEAGDEEQGISEILLHPSPVKPVIATSQRQPTNRRSSQPQSRSMKTTSSARNRDRSSESRDLEEDSEQDSEQDGEQNGDQNGETQEAADEPAPEVVEQHDGQDVESCTTLKDIIPNKKLEAMLELVNRVGKRQYKSTNTWEVVKTHKIAFTVPGKRILRRLKSLVRTYTALLALGPAQEAHAQSIRTEASRQLAALLKEAETVYRERLGSKNDVILHKERSNRLGSTANIVSEPELKRIKSMLTDVYFFLVPNLVKVLKLSVEAYRDEEILETDAIKQVSDILDLLRKIGNRAIQQPKDIQLDYSGYRTSSSIRAIIQDVRQLYKRLHVELGTEGRSKQIEAEAWKAGAVERQRKRAAEEEKERLARRREEHEISRKQREAVEAKLRDPSLAGALLRKELEKGRMKEAERRAATSSQLNQQRSWQASVRQRSDAAMHSPDPFDVDYEPIKDYDDNRKKNPRGLQPLSEEESLVFIHIMRCGDSTCPPGSYN